MHASNQSPARPHPEPLGHPGTPAIPAGKRLLTIEEVEHVLGVSRATVFRLIKDGELTSILIRRARRVPVEAIDAFIKAQLDALPATVS